MYGITFVSATNPDVSYHTYTDLQLLVASKTIGTPSPKTELLDIPGGDGVLDFTEFFGEVKYNNRPLSFDCSTVVPRVQFMDLFTRVQNALHGQKMKIIPDDDPDNYYIGRVTVSEFKAEKLLGKLTIDCDCEPYKYKKNQTVISQAISESGTVTITNGRRRAVPTITTTAAMTIAFGGGSWATSAGTFVIPELELVSGENIITMTGTGTITFTFQEAEL